MFCVRGEGVVEYPPKKKKKYSSNNFTDYSAKVVIEAFKNKYKI